VETGPRDDTPAVWVGRATPRPPVDPWSTAEQPIVPPHFAPPPQVIYVERPRRRRGCLFTLGVLVALVAGTATVLLLLSPALRGLVGIDNEPSDSAQPSQSPSPSPTPSPEPPPPPRVGDPVRDGVFEFVVHDVTCGVPSVGPELIGMKAEGQYCIIDLTVTNVGSVPGIFTDTAQYVTTADGTRRNANSTAGLWANEGIHVWINLVDQGDSVSGKLVFDIPVDTTIETIELHDSPFSDGVIVTVE
jgi:Telomeric repeat-binding factor 2.